MSQMSRGRLRSCTDICADCSAPDSAWASINRGVLICDECCSVHRSLGRHISQVKSLRKGTWHPTLLTMVNQLVSLGANNIWEHALLDPSQNKQGRRKPNPRDQTHPTKADFIRSKYQFLAFARKQKEGEFSSFDDLNKQLHSCVRTGNLETGLRLLSLGADPNYMHPEKGNCPLHVAAQAGHISTVELLIVYGADPGAPDVLGRSPLDYARIEAHGDLSDRLIECQYELTDRLAYYLCGRKPDHKNNQHFIIPQMADSSLDLSELAKAAKKKLQELTNHLFEELAMDVYDEVDRRENDAFWLSTQNHSTLVMDRQSIPFLPVNPELSSTRNQGRQKLARFNAREFATLVIDILSEARRRQFGASSLTQSPPDKHNTQSMNGDSFDGVADEPLYDSVANTQLYGGRTFARPDESEEEPLYDCVPATVVNTQEDLFYHAPSSRLCEVVVGKAQLVPDPLQGHVYFDAEEESHYDYVASLNDDLPVCNVRHTGYLPTMLEEEHPYDPLPSESPCNNAPVIVSKIMKKSLSNISDDEPLYDSVASEEDYSTVPNTFANLIVRKDETEKIVSEELTALMKGSGSPTSMISFTESIGSSEHSDTPITLEEYMEVKRALATSESRVSQLVQLNTELKLQVAQLSQTVQTILHENSAFRKQFNHSQHQHQLTGHSTEQKPPQAFHNLKLPNGHNPESHNRTTKHPTRPQSMFETRDNQRPVPNYPNFPLTEETCKDDETSDRDTRLRKQSAPALTTIPQGSDADYDTPPSHRHTCDSASSRSDSSGHFTSASDGSVTPGTPSHPLDLEPNMPTQEDVVKKTERITKKIQELLISAQEGNHNSYSPCSDKIHLAVCEMAAIFPQKPKTEMVQSGLRALTYSAVRLQEECRSSPMDGRGNVDYRLKTQQVIQCAYDIAKAAKQLVMLFQ